jgi:phage shock protein C
MPVNDRLYRSVDDRVLAGVCGGLAERMDIDPSVVRVAYAVIALLTGVVPMLLLYVIMAVVIPEEPGWGGVRPVDPMAPAPPGPSSWPAGAPAAGGPPSGPLPPAGPDAGGQAGIPGWTNPLAGAGGSWRMDRHAAREARRAARAARREARRGDPLPAILLGLILVAVGGLLLVRGTLGIDWSLVWPAAIVAAGVLLVVLALLPRGR